MCDFYKTRVFFLFSVCLSVLCVLFPIFVLYLFIYILFMFIYFVCCSFEPILFCQYHSTGTLTYM